MTLIKTNKAYVVAKKGHKGFIKTNKICDKCTIVDCSVARTSDEHVLISKLLNREPVRFSYNKSYSRSRSIERFDHVLFKYAVNIEASDNLLTMVLIANGNHRYHLYYDLQNDVIRIKHISCSDRSNTSSVKSKENYTEKNEALIVEFHKPDIRPYVKTVHM